MKIRKKIGLTPLSSVVLEGLCKDLNISEDEAIGRALELYARIIELQKARKYLKAHDLDRKLPSERVDI